MHAGSGEPPGRERRARPSWAQVVDRVRHGGWTSAENALLWALGAAACAARFIGLEDSPPGFFSDEFRGALHQICLGERGVSGSGDRFPLFVVGGGGGLYTPPFLYLGMLWVKLFGPSIASCRAFAAAFTLVATLATTGVARRLGGQNVARWTFLAAALSPWAFQFARIAWDPPLAPAFLMAALFFWLGRARPAELIASGVCFAAALYAYPPMRLQAPLVFGLVLVWVARGRVRWRNLAIFAIVGLAVAAPLIAGTLDGSLNRRGSVESIFSAAFVRGGRGDSSAGMFMLRTFLDNLHAHFRPTYLFFMGDENVRHSTRGFGLFSLVDDLALLIGLAWLAFRGYQLSLPSQEPAPNATGRVALTVPRARLAAFSAVAYVLGVVPAALCWSGVPHALRSIGSWPFLAMLTGVTLAVTRERWGRAVSALALGVSALHVALFVPLYFGAYPRVARIGHDWYDVSVKETFLAERPDPGLYARYLDELPEAFRYYEIAYRGATCRSSEERWVEARRKLGRE